MKKKSKIKASRSDDMAIALRYDGKNAPTVTAKGQHDLAEKIKQIAEHHQVPIYYEPILTQVLSLVELGEQIPESLYVAVAEVIAFAYLLSGKVQAIPEYIPGKKSDNTQ